MAKIEFEDKVALIENADIPEINKITDDNVNEIKQVVNENDDKFLTNGLNVSNEVDEDYKVNFIKGKNKVQLNNIYMQYGINDVNGTLASNQPTRVCIFQVKVKPNTQYTISCASGYLIGNVFQYNESRTYTTKVESEYARSKQYTSNSTTHYISFVLRNTDNTTIPTSEISNIKVQVEEGTETTYEPYITPSIYVDGEEIYSKMKVYTDTYATYFKFDKMVCCVVNRQVQTTDGTIATIPSEFACANDMRNVINYYNGSSYVSGILWSQNVGLYIRDMYGNIPSNASFIRGMLIWEAKN